MKIAIKIEVYIQMYISLKQERMGKSKQKSFSSGKAADSRRNIKSPMKGLSSLL